MCLCGMFHFKINEGKLNTNSINREWVVNGCNHCVLYCFNYRNFKLKIVWKLLETHFLPTWWKVDWEMEFTSIYKSKVAPKKYKVTFFPDTPQNPQNQHNPNNQRNISTDTQEEPGNTTENPVSFTVILECLWELMYRKTFTQFYVVWL